MCNTWLIIFYEFGVDEWKADEFYEELEKDGVSYEGFIIEYIIIGSLNFLFRDVFNLNYIT